MGHGGPIIGRCSIDSSKQLNCTTLCQHNKAKPTPSFPDSTKIHRTSLNTFDSKRSPCALTIQKLIHLKQRCCHYHEDSLRHRNRRQMRRRSLYLRCRGSSICYGCRSSTWSFPCGYASVPQTRPLLVTWGRIQTQGSRMEEDNVRNARCAF
jgi:hypothetical protein